MENQYYLNHEKLNFYQFSIQFLAKSTLISNEIPRGFGELKDQLKRASLSIPLNISEGYGKESNKDKKRFLNIARSSAHECGAILDSMKILMLIEKNDFIELKKLLRSIVCMMIKFSQSIK